LRAETLRALAAPPVAPSRGFRDAALKVDVRFSLGFAKPAPDSLYLSPASFGMPGAGGSFGFADPETGVGYGYVPNRMGTYLTDPRDLALRAALARSIAGMESRAQRRAS
jgi:CubicO group peptidase (beta-lactamase class C family)